MDADVGSIGRGDAEFCCDEQTEIVLDVPPALSKHEVTDTDETLEMPSLDEASLRCCKQRPAVPCPQNKPCNRWQMDHGLVRLFLKDTE